MARKKRSKARRLTKRQRAARKAVRTRKKNQAMRSRRAKKANRTRIRRHGRGRKFGAAKEARKRPRRRRRHAAEVPAAASPRRRRGGKRRHKRRHAAEVPAAASPKRKRGRRRTKRRSGHRVSPKRRRAALKAARTRARNKAKRRGSHRRGAAKRSHRRRAVRSGSHGMSHKSYRYHSDPYAGESRRRRRRHKGQHRHMAHMPNPVGSGGPMEFLTALGGLALGGLATIASDRFFGASHALKATAVTGTAATSFADAPAAGEVYNAVGPATPIWSSWKRLVAAAANVVAPFALASWLGKGRPSVKSFFQLWGFSSLTVTTVKAGTDVAAKVLGSKTWLNGLGPRLFAPEIDAANALATVKAGSALPAYTLVAGGTGPAPAPAATGNTTLGATPKQVNGQCPPGYTKSGLDCVPADNPPARVTPPEPPPNPPTVTPPVMTQPPGVPTLPPEGNQPPVYTPPPTPPSTTQPPYFAPPGCAPTPDDNIHSPEQDCGYDACAGDMPQICNADHISY